MCTCVCLHTRVLAVGDLQRRMPGNIDSLEHRLLRSPKQLPPPIKPKIL